MSVIKLFLLNEGHTKPEFVLSRPMSSTNKKSIATLLDGHLIMYSTMYSVTFSMTLLSRECIVSTFKRYYISCTTCGQVIVGIIASQIALIHLVHKVMHQHVKTALSELQVLKGTESPTQPCLDAQTSPADTVKAIHKPHLLKT